MGKLNIIPDKVKFIYFAIWFFAISLILSLSYLRVFDGFEYSMFDFRYSLRPAQSVDQRITIIEIGDDSIEKLGKWPFPRNYHALLVEGLKFSGAETIVFDMFFSEEKEDDASFAKALEDAGNVYLGYVFEPAARGHDKTCLYAEKYSAPLLEKLAIAAKGSGFVNVELDRDGKVRKIPPFIEYKGKLYPHLTVLAALDDLGFDFERIRIVPGKEIVLNKDFKIPLGEDSSLLVNYPAKWGKAFRHYSYVDVLQSYLAGKTGEAPILDLGKLKGSICFIGFTATASPDAHPSPLEPQYPGSGVHASVYNSIIKKNFLWRVDRFWNLLILVIVCFITAYITERSRKRFAMAAILLIMASYFAIATLLLWPFRIWVDLFCPLIAIVAVYIIFTIKKYLSELQKREFMEKELDIAKDIQRSILPQHVPKMPNFDIYAGMLTARQVGGDLYDIIQLDDKRLGVMIADVSGKGVPAALYMARVASVFKAFDRRASAGSVLKSVNEKLLTEDSSKLFVTLSYVIFDAASRKISFASGGHLPVLMIAPGGSIEFLDVKGGFPLGIVDCDFTVTERDYAPGSVFILYTDGVIEAKNTRGEMFDKERLVNLVKGKKDSSASEIVNYIYKKIADFTGRAKQHDDITLVAVRTN